ncbi:MAG TPA: hypothetical protein VGK50_08535 [Coriobacteriia bacterium]|jgi:hypothetical protein
MRAGMKRAAIAAALAGAMLASGCEVFAEPIRSTSVETIGVDPTGENIDTSTVPPTDTAEEPLVAPSSPPPPVAQTPVQPPPQPPPQVAPPGQNANGGISGPVPSVIPRTGGTSGYTHHHRRRSSSRDRSHGNGD